MAFGCFWPGSQYIHALARVSTWVRKTSGMAGSNWPRVPSILRCSEGDTRRKMWFFSS
jgi:hypothetical protein